MQAFNNNTSGREKKVGKPFINMFNGCATRVQAIYLLSKVPCKAVGKLFEYCFRAVQGVCKASNNKQNLTLGERTANVRYREFVIDSPTLEKII